MKNFIKLGLLGSALILLGAGCSNYAQPTATPGNTNTNPAPVTTNEYPDDPPLPDFQVFNGEATANVGEVKLQWSTDVGAKNKIRLINGSTPGREVTEGAYWQDLVGSNDASREYIWSGLKSGKRYFRVCELKDGECIQPSNEIEIMVK